MTREIRRAIEIQEESGARGVGEHKQALAPSGRRLGSGSDGVKLEAALVMVIIP
jgi:hypothetical protein